MWSGNCRKRIHFKDSNRVIHLIKNDCCRLCASFCNKICWRFPFNRFCSFWTLSSWLRFLYYRQFQNNTKPSERIIFKRKIVFSSLEVLYAARKWWIYWVSCNVCCDNLDEYGRLLCASAITGYSQTERAQ